MPNTKGLIEGLDECKRYIATHDNSGRSVYAESPEQHYSAGSVEGGVARSYSVGSVPAVLDNDADISAYRAEEGPTSYTGRDIVNKLPGANLIVIDLAPKTKSAMHRTPSIDFSICVQGTIEHELDSGEKRLSRPGVSRY